jgi:hypothetical protein
MKTAYSPIRSHNKHIAIHRQVLPIPAPYIQPHGPGLEVLQEAFDNGPGLLQEKKKKKEISLLGSGFLEIL